MLDDLVTAQGLAALVALAVALVALVVAIVLAFKLRRVRAAQIAVLGDHGRHDLVAHGEQLQQGYVDLRGWAEETLERFEGRIGAAEGRIDDCIVYRSLIRYDAYGEMSGQQSSTLALLDARRSGIVVSSILHRDQARLYVKQVEEGESELDLSPEEMQAMEAALAPAPA